MIKFVIIGLLGIPNIIGDMKTYCEDFLFTKEL